MSDQSSGMLSAIARQSLQTWESMSEGWRFEEIGGEYCEEVMDEWRSEKMWAKASTGRRSLMRLTEGEEGGEADMFSGTKIS